MEKQINQPSGEPFDFVSLCLARPDDLELIMRLGTPPKLTDLVDWEFKGYNHGDITDLLGIRKFKKGFYRKDKSQNIEEGIDGYNVKVIQNNLGEPWIDVIKSGDSVKHGWYRAEPCNLRDFDNKYPNSVLLNYGKGGNFFLDPSGMLRDYLVKVYPDNKDLMLGKAFFALGQLRFFGGYFILERSNRSSLA